MSAKAYLTSRTLLAEMKIAIICEDLECGKYAKELEDHLLFSLQSKVEFVPEVWTFPS